MTIPVPDIPNQKSKDESKGVKPDPHFFVKEEMYHMQTHLRPAT